MGLFEKKITESEQRERERERESSVVRQSGLEV